jgi:hypothetical protein
MRWISKRPVNPPHLWALNFPQFWKWRVGTIARQLHVHHGTVARVLAQAGLPRIGPPARRSQVEPYLPFIHQTLEKFPTLTASRLYAMVCERGYRGSGDHFRQFAKEANNSQYQVADRPLGATGGL